MSEYTIKILSQKKLINSEVRKSLKNLGGKKILEKKNGQLFEIYYCFGTISSRETFSKILKGAYGAQISIKKLNSKRSKSRSSSPKRKRSRSRSSSPKRKRLKSRSSSPKRKRSRSPIRSLRPSPSISATIQPLGKILRGGDGNNWIVKQIGNSKRWARLK